MKIAMRYVAQQLATSSASLILLLCSFLTLQSTLFSIQSPASINHAPRHWNWNAIDITAIDFHAFPQHFLWGCSICEFQNSGSAACPTSNWAHWEEKPKTIKHGHRSGIACDWRNNYKEYVALLKNLGFTALRFSFDWSMLEPRKGEWNQDAIAYYKAFLHELAAAGIKPMATMHHFVHPMWFEQKGGFENTKNLPDFVNFCSKIFDLFYDQVSLWCTINEPGIYAFQGYMRGVFPPGKCNLSTGGLVLQNLLIAHVAIYKKIKAKKHGKNTQIGFAHQHLLFEAFHPGNKAETCLTNYLSHLVTTAIVSFFKTGVFEFKAYPVDFMFGGLPISWKTYTYIDSTAPKSLDFLGLNYYSHAKLDWTRPTGPAYATDDIPTDMPYAIYAEGFYHTLHELSTLNVPIYVTENGIADACDDRRALFIQRYLYALSQALQDGIDVRGYFYWTLLDNFEWDEGYTMKFGLCAFDHEQQTYTVRFGSQALFDIIKNHTKALESQGFC